MGHNLIQVGQGRLLYIACPNIPYAVYTCYFMINSYFIVLSLLSCQVGPRQNKEDPHCFGKGECWVNRFWVEEKKELGWLYACYGTFWSGTVLMRFGWVLGC